ncbi:hypothetical protein ASESINO_204 [Erwinia phage vB_EamM_Asesino]|uniref:Uncharacterized protein n=1 Tax=Erwinia phage vB_EamM_Asesino TaxID=1883370 RepID=A0A1B2IAC1_9CAUD|nr:hypothetical protein ASESINO_204 [Erwinia phage vB_EamM_Asesino]ANZ48217.1 hypothetical protein ASESINO_204 [Erwinia phage vB_EamM_Asesino]
MRGVVGCILFVIAFAVSTVSATASTSVSDLLLADTPYSYNPPSFEVCTTQADVCSELGQHDHFILVKADGGASCPAGYYFVLDSAAKEIIPVDTVTCDPTLKVTLAKNTKTKKHLVVVEQQGKTVGSVPLEN